jgi:hypothetical protein
MLLNEADNDDDDDGNDGSDIHPIQLLYITRGQAALFVLDQPDVFFPSPSPSLYPSQTHLAPPFSSSSVTPETSPVSGPTRILLRRSHHIINNTVRNSVVTKQTAIVNLSLRMNNLLDSHPPSDLNLAPPDQVSASSSFALPSRPLAVSTRTPARSTQTPMARTSFGGAIARVLTNTKILQSVHHRISSFFAVYTIFQLRYGVRTFRIWSGDRHAHIQEKDVCPVPESKSPLQPDPPALHAMYRQEPRVRLCTHGPLFRINSCFFCY